MQATDTVTLARALMNYHGLGHWLFQFDRAKRRAGCCKYSRSMITLSIYYVSRNGEEDVRDTILHEIAHALAGPGTGHGRIWKLKCLEIGARPVRCYSRDVDMPEGRYSATCGGCQRKFVRHRRRKRTLYCSACGPEIGRLSFSEK